ncbi:MAG: glycosyltransferase [Candidatus Omnitrophica bacterium]|nr:glycosyltransferase [Candidatus Omnitrophota bacterium]
MSIVIPFYNGMFILARCLSSLSPCACDGAWEVIVVHDGSALPAMDYRWPRPDVPLKMLHLDRQRGQSAATNAGIRAAQGEYVLLFAQDMLAAPALLHAHMQAHRQRPDGNWAILGAMPFAPEIVDSDFYDFLLTGPQFAFKQFVQGEYRDAVADGQELSPAQCFYAPNISLKRQVLFDAGLFDEDLPYGAQDLELGYRLQQRGLHLQYNEAACAGHYHKYTLESFCQKQEVVGRTLKTVYAKAPALRNDRVGDVYHALQPYETVVAAMRQFIHDGDGNRPLCFDGGALPDIPVPLFQNVRQIWQKSRDCVNGMRPDQVPMVLLRSLRYLFYKILVSYSLGKGFLSAK